MYAGLRWIPPRPRPPAAEQPLEVPAVVLPVGFVEAGPLDLNRATAAELERLPGIGPVLARRIVEWRETYGPFRSVQDLLKVPGIGPKTLEGLLDKVTVGSPP
ncbi:MAG: helix-hairpin-helix domain-containing protein [Candidatus Bipolaricaulota bacterium]|nr:helix-hairpin-helix domain-containing protein [Candidatus Bipolaricaulota bacterium]MCX7844627.1 helix-hairpin-helix domain-containing protein [Candidatus Bipolaricaulota bacterium]MDW8151639.1 helix-hairpin-helix domain-containing protein [Candidatus Bipolaricaulota bacterium]